jgi:hypothetical protein
VGEHARGTLGFDTPELLDRRASGVDKLEMSASIQKSRAHVGTAEPSSAGLLALSYSPKPRAG